MKISEILINITAVVLFAAVGYGYFLVGYAIFG